MLFCGWFGSEGNEDMSEFVFFSLRTYRLGESLSSSVFIISIVIGLSGTSTAWLTSILGEGSLFLKIPGTLFFLDGSISKLCELRDDESDGSFYYGVRGRICCYSDATFLNLSCT